MINNILRKIHPREFLERKAYDWLFANRRRKFDVIEKAATEYNCTSLEIAQRFGSGNVLLGCVYLLASNNMKKTSLP